MLVQWGLHNSVFYVFWKIYEIIEKPTEIHTPEKNGSLGLSSMLPRKGRRQ